MEMEPLLKSHPKAWAQVESQCMTWFVGCVDNPCQLLACEHVHILEPVLKKDGSLSILFNKPLWTTQNFYEFYAHKWLFHFVYAVPSLNTGFVHDNLRLMKYMV